MMKRFLAMLLSVCLLAAAACASADEPLRVIDDGETAQAYQAAYPERAIEINQAAYEEDGDLDAILLGGEWDAAIVWSDSTDWKALNEAGLLMDLQTVPEIVANAERLYASVRNAVTMEGKLVAYPVRALVALTQSVHMTGASETRTERAEDCATLQRLGFSPTDRPATFAELCTLGERYMLLSAETRKGTTFLTANQPTYEVVHELVELYNAQCLATGACADFDDEVFRTALAQADALNAALANDPKNRYADDGTLSELVSRRGFTLIGDAFFLRLGDSPCVPANTALVILNPNGGHAREAIDYALLAMQQNQSNLAPLLYADVDFDAIVRQSYDETIAMKIEGGAEQAVIDELMARRDAGDESGCNFTRAEIERYRADVAPNLVFPKMTYFDASAAIQRHLSGETDADGLIAELNAAYAAKKEEHP